MGEAPEFVDPLLVVPGCMVCVLGCDVDVLGSVVIAPEFGVEPGPLCELPFGLMVGSPGAVGDIEELVPDMGALAAG